MATCMEDTDILGQISPGDLVAFEAKYHHSCLTKYRNQYRSFCRRKNHENITDNTMGKAQAFVEVISKIEDDR